MAAKKISKEQNGLSFEKALEELEGTVRQLEDGKIPLAEALAEYEKGIKHLKTCYELLEHAERRIEVLSGVDADGNPVMQPFDPNDPSPKNATAERKAVRQRRSKTGRSRTTSHENVDTDIDDEGRLF